MTDSAKAQARSRLVLHYRILEEIGRGGMSIVYRAVDEKLGRDVAVKVLHPFLANKADCRRRLAREAKTISKLDHPHILSIFDYSREIDFSQTLTPISEDEDGPADLFIVTELVRGTTLKDFAEKHELWNTPEIGAVIIREIALALHFAHTRKVVHRDIKPENIMVGDNGVLKLMDFGIAYVKDQESLTMTGTLLGSPAYMAPEIIEGKAGDFRSDIFSLSTVFYWLVTGELPFEGSNPHTLLRNIVEGRHKAIEEVSAKVSNTIRAVIEKGMETEPEKRFENAHEFAEAISAALAFVSFDISSLELQKLLQAPEEGIEAAGVKIRDAALLQAQEFFESGNFLQGAENLNRVLADDPTNEAAAVLFERFNHLVTVPKKAGKKRYVALAMAALMASLAAGIFLHLEEAPKEAQPIIPLLVETVDKVIFPPLEKGVGGFSQGGTPKNPPTPFSKGGKISKPNQIAPTVLTVPTATITVVPFADIWMDGKEIAKNSSRLEVPLNIGDHKFAFKHEFAATEERALHVSKDSGEMNLHVELERSKPASLIVRSNVDADIAVDGAYKGTSTESAERPIVIPLPKKTHGKKLEIIVSQKGFLPYVASHTVIAGKSQTIDVTLQPESKID